MQAIKKFVKLKNLDLLRVRFNNQDITALDNHVENLKRLCLNGCGPITEDTMSHIAILINLESLTITNSDTLKNDMLSCIEANLKILKELDISSKFM